MLVHLIDILILFNDGRLLHHYFVAWQLWPILEKYIEAITYFMSLVRPGNGPNRSSV